MGFSARVAVLGCGSIGRRHLRNLMRLGETDLIGFDPAAETRGEVQAELGVRIAASLDEVWAGKPTVALITGPTHAHFSLALEAVRRGCDIFIEKPLAHSFEGMDGLEKEAEDRELVTMVGCNLRFHPGPAAVKRLLEQRAIGEVIAARLQTGSYLPRWRPQQDYRQSYSASPAWGGTVLDCIHEIDLALWYFGPAAVAGAATVPAKSLGLETDGLAEFILRHKSGVLGSVHLNFVQRDYRRTCQVIGTEGTIYWDFNARRVEVFGPDGRLASTLPEPDGWELNQMYVDELSHFLHSVEARTPTMNPLSGGRAALEIALQVRCQ